MKTTLIRRTLLATAALVAILPGIAQARCDKLVNAKAGEINIIGNSFPALAHIAKEMESCTQGGLKVQFKMTPNARTEIEQAFATQGKSAFDAAVVSGGVFTNLNARFVKASGAKELYFYAGLMFVVSLIFMAIATWVGKRKHATT